LIRTGGKSMTVLEGQALLDHGQTIARRYARRVGPEAAEELKAEAILRALASPPPDGRMEPWLERIYRNLFVDLWRRGTLRRVDVADFDALPAQGTPEDEVLRRERRRVVRAGLRSLSRESRRAVLSKYYGEDHDDVAAARLGVAPVTVRTRIHRALARLRTRMGDLRSVVPFGRLGGQLATAGVAPAMVAALWVATSVPSTPDVPVSEACPMVTVRAPAAVTVASVPEEITPAPVMRPSSRVHVHKTSVTAPVATDNPAIAPAETVVSEVLAPDGLIIFANPEPLVSPCMVEPPASLLAQIDKMIEDTL
jgi:RNA polymerase sigma factor (sigma-70 family)